MAILHIFFFGWECAFLIKKKRTKRLKINFLLMSVNMSVFFTLCYTAELKKKQLLHSEVFSQCFVLRSANCVIWGVAFAGLGFWWPCCICVYISPVTGQRPEPGHFSPFQNQSWWSLTKPCVTEIGCSQESILLNFYLPLTF